MDTFCAFGCTGEEFDRLYDETNGFNTDVYKNCQVSDGSFDAFLIDGSESLSKNSKISKYL